MMWQIIKKIVVTGIATENPPDTLEMESQSIHDEILKILCRALTIREIDAGSCNGCELELNALGNLYYNLEGLGIKFVASPRHADMLLITGPITRNMSMALALANEATPMPKVVIAVGDCAINGGIFGESYATIGGASKVLHVDLEIPGCPPEPRDILQGILSAVRYGLGKRSS